MNLRAATTRNFTRSATAGVFSRLDGDWTPTMLGNTAAWYDVSGPASTTSDYLRIDASNRVSLIADKSGNSAVNCYCSAVAAANYMSAGNKTVTGNQVFTLTVGLDDYTPASDVTVVNKLSGNDGFQILVLTTGVVRLRVGDGASVTNVDSSVAFTMTDLRKHVIGITWNDGVGASFTQDGVAVGTAVAAAKTLTNAAVSITVGTCTGRIYRFQAAGVYDCNPALASKLATSFSSGGDTWSITASAADLSARIAGERDLYQATAAKQPIYLQYSGTKYAYFHGVAGFTVSVPLANDTYDVSIGYLDGTTDTSTVVVGSGTATFGGTDAKFSGKKVRTITVLKSSVQQAKFDADYYVSGTTFTSSDTKTWTLNGGATIVDRTCIYFDGSDDYMKAPAFSLSQPESVYFVGRQVSWTANDRIFGGGQNNAELFQQTSTPGLGINAASSVGPNNDLAVKTAGVVTVVFNGASSALRINRGTATTGNAGANNTNGFTAASDWGISAYGNITASEILIRSAADATATQDRIALYAGRKWGIAV